MTDNTALAQELETLSRQSEAGTLMMYGEPDVGLSSQPFFGEPLKGDMRPLADWHGADADLVIALWNNLPTILAALRTPAPAPVGGDVVEQIDRDQADRFTNPVDDPILYRMLSKAFAAHRIAALAAMQGGDAVLAERER